LVNAHSWRRAVAIRNIATQLLWVRYTVTLREVVPDVVLKRGYKPPRSEMLTGSERAALVRVYGAGEVCHYVLTAVVNLVEKLWRSMVLQLRCQSRANTVGSP
jgi:hypothetical protein